MYTKNNMYLHTKFSTYIYYLYYLRILKYAHGQKGFVVNKFANYWCKPP